MTHYGITLAHHIAERLNHLEHAPCFVFLALGLLVNQRSLKTSISYQWWTPACRQGSLELAIRALKALFLVKNLIAMNLHHEIKEKHRVDNEKDWLVPPYESPGFQKLRGTTRLVCKAVVMRKYIYIYKLR